ncbi:MAG: ATP-binding protein [Egibacteraceae bacterium]
MAFQRYDWPLVDRFLDREAELDRLDSWWNSQDRMPLAVHGRRRVGKSWLLRRFAHGKPAVLLAAERLAAGAQLSRFAGQLASFTDRVAPDLPDVPALVRTLYRVAARGPLLAVIDEFPWVLGSTAAEVERTLSSIQAVLEDERDTSQLKLVVCGSAVAQMEALQAERNPLHGRLVPLEVRPLDPLRATVFLPALDPLHQVERYAVTGGMPRYLAALGGASLADAVCDQLLRPDAPLWNEGRTIVGQELREPAVHFGILERLATGEKELADIAKPLRLPGGTVSKYLATLESLRLVQRRLPFGASSTVRAGHWALDDPFLRFWFRFVFPYQADLEAGLAPPDLYQTEIAPALADHVAPTFEDTCRAHARSQHGRDAPRIGRWWGPARHDLRRSGVRSTEEIDIVGVARRRVTLVGEAKWTAKPLDVTILRDLAEYKLPALEQAGFTISPQYRTVLYCRSGYTDGLRRRAEGDTRLELVDVARAVAPPGATRGGSG